MLKTKETDGGKTKTMRIDRIDSLQALAERVEDRMLAKMLGDRL